MSRLTKDGQELVLAARQGVDVAAHAVSEASERGVGLLDAIDRLVLAAETMATVARVSRELTRP